MNDIDPALLFRDALQAEFQACQHRQTGEQAGFLKDITQCAFVWRDENLLVAVLPDFIVDLDKPRASARSRPAMQRRQVVLPEPE